MRGDYTLIQAPTNANAKLPSKMSKFLSLMGATEPFDSTHRFETSWLLPPWALAAVRALISLYCFVVTFFIIGWDGSHDHLQSVRRSFSYFTGLTYWGLAFYFAFAAFHTFGYARRGYAALTRWPRFLQALHSLFYSTIVTYPFLVTIVYWVVLYKPPFFPIVYDAWSNISRHGLNSAFALFEVFFTRTNPPPWLHLPFLIIILGLYLALAYLTYATQGFYTYNFLDPATGGSKKVAAYAFGILAAIIIIFLVVYGLIWLRKWLTERVLKMTGKLHRGRSLGQADLEMESLNK